VDLIAVLVIAALIGVALYLSGTRNPLRTCPRCKGSGRRPATLVPGRYRPCPRCRRSGEIRGRFGRP
jgi:DnaJ-class molecular chaperone